MAEGTGRARQLRKGRRHDGPLIDRRVHLVGRARGARGPIARRRLVRLAAIGGIGEHDDVTRLGDRVDQRLVGLGAGGRLTAHVELLATVALEKLHVVDDEPRGRAGEVVDEETVDETRPGPAADERLHFAQRLFVDLHHDELRGRPRGIDGPPHPDVVERPLEGTGQRQTADRERHECGRKADTGNQGEAQALTAPEGSFGRAGGTRHRGRSAHGSV